MKTEDEKLKSGAIAWMVSHPVTANLIMLVLLAGGFFSILNIKQEVFPEFELDTVVITVSYPGATPEEIEKGITLPIEEELQDIDNIDEITSSSSEGNASITVELSRGANNNKVYQDIKNAIDRINSLPEKAEDPKVSLSERKSRVIDLVVYGNLSEHILKDIAERLRLRLLESPEISSIEMSGVRNPEISVEVPMEKLRRYSLTLPEIAEKIKAASLEQGSGTVKDPGGEIMLKIDERKDYGREFAQIPIVISASGTYLRLSDIATVRDDFEDNDQYQYYNGLPAATIRVNRVGKQTPKGVSNAVKEVLAEWDKSLPEGVKIAIWDDRSDVLQQRIDLLIRNIWMGLMLVIITLGCFLQVRLAFWVMMGIPISFLGSFIFLPVYDISINMISLFAFITALGMVVDDAIVVGENIFEMRQKGYSYTKAAIIGTKQVAVPVIFSIITNIVAFAPLLFVPGFIGKIFRVIPIVVISVFIISLFEALFVLPAHLAHQKHSRKGDIWSYLNKFETWFSIRLQWFIRHCYRPMLVRCMRNRYISIAIALGIMMIAVSYYLGGHISLIFMPNTASDTAIATIELPYGTPVSQTRIVHDRMIKAARNVADKYEKETGRKLLVGINSNIGIAGRRRGAATSLAGGHTTSTEVLLVPTDDRTMSTTEFRDLWREAVGKVEGAERSVFLDDPHGPGGGDPISIRIGHRDINTLRDAADDLAEVLSSYAGVRDIDNGFSRGKPQYDLKLTPAARSAGLTSSAIANQIRGAYYGAEALRQQRDRDEIKVMVRLPRSERSSLHDLEHLIIQTPNGDEMALGEAVETLKTKSETSIVRINGKRQVSVAADIIPQIAAGKVTADVMERYAPTLQSKYPGLSFEISGQREDLAQSLSSLIYGSIIALFVVYAVLAIPFDSYLQPIIIMVSIPFGIIGAVAGHLIMGYNFLCITSFMGIVALCGVVVNDSLVMVDYINQQRANGRPLASSVLAAGVRRLRPIMLTSVTTFGGLAPMIFETSRQATFMIPMALSLGYGILFATFIALLLVPALYLVVEDAKKVYARFWEWKIF